MSFPEVPHNLGTGPIPLEDVGDILFFNDERVDAVIKRVVVLEKAKAEIDKKLKVSDARLKEIKEKLKNVEAENIVLKNSGGVIVENWTRESMKEVLGLNDVDKFTSDFEKDIENNAPGGDYVFKMVYDADNFNDVVIEDDSDSDHEKPMDYSGQDDDFPKFVELFRSQNEDDLRRKVVEKLR
ncbi:hypothetical protein Hanom_Chr11g01013621 [Helianthus anomalus]